LADALATLEGRPRNDPAGSTWLYPLVNAGHIVGIALLFGAIAPLDLRLIGAWNRISLDVFLRILVPVAVAGLGLAACAGACLHLEGDRLCRIGVVSNEDAMLALGVRSNWPTICSAAARRRQVGWRGVGIHSSAGA
jgi:hypothetical protein